MDSLFVPDGDGWRATPCALGPWSPGALHGGAPVALIAGELEALDAPVPMHPARFTVDLLRPVPVGPLRIEYGPIRDGARIQLLAAAADFADGISGTLPFGKWLFINPDLTVHLHRLAVGEWIGLDAASFVEPHGVGMSDARLHDERGPIGRSNQTLLIDHL